WPPGGGRCWSAAGRGSGRSPRRAAGRARRPAGAGRPARGGLRGPGSRAHCLASETDGASGLCRRGPVRCPMVGMSTGMADETVEFGPGALTFDQVVAVARGGARVALSDEALKLVAEARAHVEELAARPTPVYGVSAGFGALATRHIPPELRAQLQLNIVRSHAAGTGPEVEREVVRALMLLRLRTLATGRTGVQPVT